MRKNSEETYLTSMDNSSFRKLYALEYNYYNLLERIIKGKGNLRFNQSFIPASSIAEQYYCEKKVELAYIYGKKETLDMKLGEEAHEKLLEDTTRIELRECLSKIISGIPIVVREMLLLCEYKEVIIAGYPDCIYFDKGVPMLLFEYKFTKHNYPWRNYHVQARIYCLQLSLMGFNTEKLKYALILASPNTVIEKGLIEKLERKIILNQRDKNEIKIKGKIFKVFLEDFEINQAKEDLNWAIDFWKNKRKAIPTKKLKKCNVCGFNQSFCSNFLVSTPFNKEMKGGNYDLKFRRK